jgi:hypothetical protein
LSNGGSPKAIGVMCISVIFMKRNYLWKSSPV